jgi:hypothetical protein
VSEPITWTLVGQDLRLWLLVWALIVLLLPYRLEYRLDFLGHEHVVWESLLWRWGYGPGYEEMHFHGLQRLQRVLLGLLGETWKALRGALLRWAVGEIRRWLGV